MPAVGCEITVQGENPAGTMKLREPDQTGVSQGHGSVRIPLHQRLEGCGLALDFEIGFEKSCPQGAEHGKRIATAASQEKAGFSNHRLASHERGNMRGENVARPRMVRVSPVEISYQWPSVENVDFSHLPNSLQYTGFELRSPGPSNPSPSESIASAMLANFF